MTAAAEITSAVLDGLASLGVPWWGWTALAVMIFMGLLGPSSAQGDPAPEVSLGQDWPGSGPAGAPAPTIST